MSDKNNHFTTNTGEDFAPSELEALVQAFNSMYGHAPWALLEDVVRIAREQFRYRGSAEDARNILEHSGLFHFEISSSIPKLRIRRRTGDARASFKGLP